MSNRAKTISEMTTEINDLRLSILYLERRITRKQIAIQELLLGSDDPCAPEVPEVEIPICESSIPTGPQVPTVPRMIHEALSDLNGSTFYYSDLKTRILEKHPGAKSKIVGVYPAVRDLLTRGVIMRVPGGFQRTHQQTTS